MYWNSISSQWSELNQYIVSVTPFVPVYHEPPPLEFWTAIFSAFSYEWMQRVTTEPVYRHGNRHWTSISHGWPVLTQYIVSVTTTDTVYYLGDHFRPSTLSQSTLLTQYIVTLTQYIASVTSTYPVYRIGDQFWPSISSRLPVTNQCIIFSDQENRLSGRCWPSKL